MMLKIANILSSYFIHTERRNKKVALKILLRTFEQYQLHFIAFQT